MLKRFKRCLVAGLILAGILFITGKFFFMPYIVIGDSMEPTLHSKDICLMRRLDHYEPHRGDIVMFRTADDPPLYYVKRVISLPGETVSVAQGIASINGVRLSEPYVETNPDWQMEPVTVPAGKLFMIGDNRSVPGESTWHGLVAIRLVKSRYVWHGRFLP